MIKQIIALCQNQPELLIFLSLGLGYAIGKLKFKGFSLGATASVLIVALALGQIPGIVVPGLLKTVSFSLFVFCIGYSVGPQFFGALKKQGLSYIWIALVVAAAALITTLALGKLFHFGPGTTAGLLAGALTTSAAIGTAEGAISHLPGLTAAAKTAMETDVAIAYGITYIFGTVGGILTFTFLPRFMGLNLKDEAKKLEASYSGGDGELDQNPALFSWSKQLSLRAYRVENQALVGKTLPELEALFPERTAVEAMKRNGQKLELTTELTLEAGDLLILGSPSRKSMLMAVQTIGPEQDISRMSDVIGEVMNICVLNKKVAGKTIEETDRVCGTGHRCHRYDRGWRRDCLRDPDRSAGGSCRRDSHLAGCGRGRSCFRPPVRLAPDSPSHLWTDSLRQPLDSPESRPEPVHRLCRIGRRKPGAGRLENHGSLGSAGGGHPDAGSRTRGLLLREDLSEDEPRSAAGIAHRRPQYHGRPADAGRGGRQLHACHRLCRPLCRRQCLSRHLGLPDRQYHASDIGKERRTG